MSYLELESHARFVGEPALRLLPDVLVIHYKPILFNLIYITETVTYHKNIRTNHIYEMGIGSYHFAILGISVREFIDGFHFFKPKAAQVKEAFSLLFKTGIIQPITIFRDEMRYVLADYELYFLIKNIQPISETDLAVNNIRKTLGHLIMKKSKKENY